MARGVVRRAPVVPVQVEGTADALARLEAAIQADGSAKAWADRVGISDVYVSDVRRGVRKPGPAVLRALGLRRVVRIETEEALS